MGFFSVTGDEGQNRPIAKLDCLFSKQIKFSAEAQQSRNRFQGRVDTEPSTPVLTISTIHRIPAKTSFGVNIARQLDTHRVLAKYLKVA